MSPPSVVMCAEPRKPAQRDVTRAGADGHGHVVGNGQPVAHRARAEERVRAARADPQHAAGGRARARGRAARRRSGPCAGRRPRARRGRRRSRRRRSRGRAGSRSGCRGRGSVATSRSRVERPPDGHRGRDDEHDERRPGDQPGPGRAPLPQQRLIAPTHAGTLTHGAVQGKPGRRGTGCRTPWGAGHTAIRELSPMRTGRARRTVVACPSSPHRLPGEWPACPSPRGHAFRSASSCSHTSSTASRAGSRSAISPRRRRTPTGSWTSSASSASPTRRTSSTRWTARRSCGCSTTSTWPRSWSSCPGALIFLYRRSRPALRPAPQHDPGHLAALDPGLRRLPGRAAAAVGQRPGRHDHDADRLRDGLQLTTSFYNELAAVPSLHVGFAVAVGIAVAARGAQPDRQGASRCCGAR